jgi:hypothetical protein
MADKKPTYYKADYYYSKGSSRTRTSISGYVSQHLHGATTESAVVNYLRSKHPGYEISLMSLDWS